MSITRRIPVNDIRVGQRLRRCDGDKIAAMMESIQALGLQTPLSVSRHADGVVQLIAGLHRLEACRRLGWEQIDVVFLDGLDEIDQQLWEIDENLIRAELTEGERSEHLLLRKQLFEAKRTRTREAGPSNSVRPQYERGFASETAERTGLTKRHINRSIRRAERIADDVRDSIRHSPAFRKAVELDALADLSHEEQRRAVELVAQNHARTFREAKEQLTTRGAQKSQTRELKILLDAWRAATDDTRRAWVRQLGSELDELRESAA